MLTTLLSAKVISIAQIVVSVLVIGLILLQERGQEASGLFGGGGGDVGGGAFYQRRRGFERILFYTTIVLLVLFAGLAILNLFV